MRPTRRLAMVGLVGGAVVVLIAIAVVMALALGSWLRGVGSHRGRGPAKVTAPVAAARGKGPRPAANRVGRPRPGATPRGGATPESAPTPQPTPSPPPSAAPPTVSVPAATGGHRAAPTPDVRRAEAALKAGHVATAIRLARRSLGKRRHDPRAHLVLGHAYYRKLWHSDALDEYARAISYDQSVRDDATVQRNAIACLGRARVARRAAAFIVDKLGVAAIPALESAARDRGDADQRRRAAAALARLKPAPP